MMLSPPLDKRNTRDKAGGLCVSSEGYIGELGVRCLSPIDRGQDSAQQSPLGKLAFLRQKALQFFGASSRRAMWTSKEATCSTWRRPVRCQCDLSPRPVLGLVSDGVLGGNCWAQRVMEPWSIVLYIRRLCVPLCTRGICLWCVLRLLKS